MKRNNLILITALMLTWTTIVIDRRRQSVGETNPQAATAGRQRRRRQVVQGGGSGPEQDDLKRFPQADKDGDGVLSIKEQQAVIRQADVPKGKETYVYKQVDGVATAKWKSDFPKGHDGFDSPKPTVPGIICFMAAVGVGAIVWRSAISATILQAGEWWPRRSPIACEPRKIEPH